MVKEERVLFPGDGSPTQIFTEVEVESPLAPDTEDFTEKFRPPS